jgi:hypothetical protein
MMSFNISYPDLIKFPYFFDLPLFERIGGVRRPKDKAFSRWRVLSN